MSNRIRDIVSKLPVNDIREIIRNYEELETEGCIGECLLRDTARNYIGDMTTISISLVMKDFAYEAYRFLALTHITVKEPKDEDG